MLACKILYFNNFLKIFINMMKNADKFLEKLKNKKFSGEFDADKFFMYHDIDGVTFENCRLY